MNEVLAADGRFRLAHFLAMGCFHPTRDFGSNEQIVREACRSAAVEEADRECAVTTRAFYVHLHEQDLRDRVECATRIHVVYVAQDRVALEREILELLWSL